jgi:ABC-2 type transport system permease protein
MAGAEVVVRPVGPSLPARLVGLGSVFGKSLRDARRTAIVIGVALGLIGFVSGSQIALEFDTPAERAALAAQMNLLPAVFRGMLGDPIAIDTLGGFLSWRVLNIMPAMLGIWSIVALSGTLAGELARGSLEMLAASPVGRRRLALEKAGAHLVALGLAVGLISVLTWVAGQIFAVLPGDEIGLGAALAHGAWMYVATVVAGAAAFAVAPLVGRGGALAVGGLLLLGSFVVNGYADVVPAFESIRDLSYFALTAGHRPLAGAWDWGAVGLLAAIDVLLLAIGVVAFTRRDLLVPGDGRGRVPRLRLGVAGLFARSFAERLPAALVWGVLLALYSALIASSADELVAAIKQIPQFTDMIENLFPGADIFSTGGFLQLAFFGEAILFMAIAAATFVSGWASDEGERRLEVVLGAPVGRLRWMVLSGLGVLTAIAATAVLLSLGVAAGASTAGDDVARPTIGALVLGLDAAALAGVGLAVGGLVRPSLAAPVTLLLGLGFYLLELIGGILRLPEAVLDLSLNRHLGRPMLGEFDAFGLVLCLALALGGLAVGAFGLARRDIGR